MFDVVEQGVFFRNDFLVNWTTDFYFYVARCLSSLFPGIIVLINIYFEHARSLKSLSYDRA